jgi:hypothetical protein
MPLATDRAKITVRIVPLASPEAGDSRMGGTVAERIAAVAELTAMAWATARRPLPSYTRASIPFALTTLAAQDADD